MKRYVWGSAVAVLLSVVMYRYFNAAFGDFFKKKEGARGELVKPQGEENESGKVASQPQLSSVYYNASMATGAAKVPEQIAGESFIKAAYGKYSPKKIRDVLQKVGTESRITTRGKGADDIKKFIDEYHLDMTDYNLENPKDFKDFNDFFYRTLKSGVRKIDARDYVVTSPADSKLRVIASIEPTSKFFIKQDFFNLKEFLHDEILAAEYAGGTLLVFRLAPTDYHRFHFPFVCTPGQPALIEGEYETVSPIAFRDAGLWPISINKRARVIIESPMFGKVVMMVVGASMVASLNFTYKPDVEVAKGAEAGYFAFGGSTVCLVFKKDTIVVPDELSKRSTNEKVASQPTLKETSTEDATYENETPFETAVRMGQGVAMKTGSENVNGLADPAYVAFLAKDNKGLMLKLGGVEIPFVWNNTVKQSSEVLSL